MAAETATTAHFVLHWDDVALPGSKAMATALQAVCETEFSTLAGWFAITSGFGAADPIHLWVDLARGGGANNRGYQAGGKTTIHVDSQSGSTNAADSAEMVKMVFVNELVEVFMSFNDQKTGTTTWNAADSAGEGLSQLCGIERFPRGHYLYYSSWVDSWLQSPARADFVTTSEATDGNQVSFGCALLFLYYLKSQLGFSVPKIIQQGGATLEATFANLTGQAGGFAAMSALVNAYFPVASTPLFSTFDDPFPLQDVSRRWVTLQTTSHDGSPSVVASGHETVSPLGNAILCPERDYSFEVDSVPVTVAVQAETQGFGQAVFAWSVNGVAVNVGGLITVQAQVQAVDPQNPTTSTSTTQSVQLDVTVSNTIDASTLRATPVGVSGLIDLTFSVAVHERFVQPADVTSTSAWSDVRTQRVVWEADYYRDAKTCKDRLRRTLQHFGPFFIWRTLPDPPPDYLRVVRELQVVSKGLQASVAERPATGREAGRLSEAILGLSPAVLAEVTRQTTRTTAV